jgi:hypothetical protein
MPILEKNGHQVLFAHIPKSGGTSIYLAFAAAGWRIINLSQWSDPRSTWCALRRQFGIDGIEQRGLRIAKLAPPQHMPAIVWRTWGHFDESFTVVRHPVGRLESALAYHHRIGRHTESLTSFAGRILLEADQRILGTWRTLGGHLIAQRHFLTATTRVFYFEHDWARELCDRYGLDYRQFPHANADARPRDFLTAEQLDWARRTYRKDYIRFGYK